MHGRRGALLVLNDPPEIQGTVLYISAQRGGNRQTSSGGAREKKKEKEKAASGRPTIVFCVYLTLLRGKLYSIRCYNASTRTNYV